MADETKTTTTETTKKSSKLGTIITIIISIIIGAGAMFGVEKLILQETHGDMVFKNYNNIVLPAAVDDVIADEGFVSIAITDAKKAEIKDKLLAKFNADDAIATNVTAALAATKAELEAAAKAEEAKIEDDLKKEVEEVKDAVTPAADAATDAAATVTENAAEAVPVVKKD